MTPDLRPFFKAWFAGQEKDLDPYCVFAAGVEWGTKDERQKWQMAVASLKDIAEHARVARDGYIEQMAITTLANLPGETP